MQCCSWCLKQHDCLRENPVEPSTHPHILCLWGILRSFSSPARNLAGVEGNLAAPVHAQIVQQEPCMHASASALRLQMKSWQ